MNEGSHCTPRFRLAVYTTKDRNPRMSLNNGGVCFPLNAGAVRAFLEALRFPAVARTFVYSLCQAFEAGHVPTESETGLGNQHPSNIFNLVDQTPNCLKLVSHLIEGSSAYLFAFLNNGHIERSWCHHSFPIRGKYIHRSTKPR